MGNATNRKKQKLKKTMDDVLNCLNNKCRSKGKFPYGCLDCGEEDVGKTKQKNNP